MRRFWGAVGMGCAAMLVATSIATPIGTDAGPEAAFAAEAGDPLVFGARVKPRSGQSLQQAVQALEAQVGRPLAAVRVFKLWNDAFPDSFDTWLRNTDHLILMSVKARRTNGTRVSWASIANAAPGQAVYDEIVGWATRVRSLGAPIYFTFNHEPEAGTNTGNGTATDFQNAWRRVATIFREQGVTNAKLLWIMTDYSFWVSPSDRRYAPKWFPGADWVDGVGADSYNWYTCRPETPNQWKSLQQIADPLRRFALQYPEEEVWLPEWASVEDRAQPNRKAQWFADARALFAQTGWEQFRGILYFHSDSNNASWPDCDWWVDTSPQALAAFGAMGADPLYGGTGEPPPPPSDELVLFVVSNPSALTTGDAAVRTRLVSGGYTVTLADDGTVTAADTAGASAVLVSASVSTSLGSRLRDVTVPVMMWKPWLYDDMRMTGSTANVDYGNVSAATIAVVSAGHPLAGGLSGAVTAYGSAQTVAFGVPASGAATVATVSGRPGVFVYEAGAPMVGGAPARACRIAFPAGASAPAAFTATGGALFDAAVDYAVGGCAASG